MTHLFSDNYEKKETIKPVITVTVRSSAYFQFYPNTDMNDFVIYRYKYCLRCTPLVPVSWMWQLVMFWHEVCFCLVPYTNLNTFTSALSTYLSAINTFCFLKVYIKGKWIELLNYLMTIIFYGCYLANTDKMITMTTLECTWGKCIFILRSKCKKW